MITIEDVERETRALIEGAKSTPEERAAKLKEQKQRIDDLAKKCGPVIYGMYRHYTAASSDQPEIALFVALEAIGIICGRVWEGEEIVYEKPDGDFGIIPAPTTTDYLTILAKTGTGKEFAKKELKLFLEGLDIPIAASTTGGSAIYYEAMKNPRLIIMQDEAGKHRQSAGSGKGDPYGPKAAETLLMDIYADRTGKIPPTIYAPGKDNPNLKPIRRNAVSCVLISTQETYHDALQSDDAHSGYLSRFVIFQSDRAPPPSYGMAVIEQKKKDEYKARRSAYLEPFWEWRPYHAGKPKLDTYGQLIRPYLATAWNISGDDIRPHQAFETAQAMRNTRKKGGEKTDIHPVFDENAPADRVKWGLGAEQVIIDIHAETEQYLADHPEARDLLTRKKQHVAQYAMRIALANSTFWQRPASTEESTPEPTPKLTKKQKKENEELLKEDARKKVDAEIGEKKTPYKITQEEAKRYEGVESVYEIKQRARADYFPRVAWRETLKDAEKDVNRLEKAVKELEAEPSPTPEDAEKLKNLRKERTAAVAREWTVRTHYNAKIDAIEIATRRVYETYLTVITKDIALLAKEIVEIANDSSQGPLIDSIPANKWYEAKEAAIKILERYGAEGFATSELERKLRKYGLQDSYAKLIAELKFEGRIEICKGGSRNGGFKLRIPQATPEPEGGLS